MEYQYLLGSFYLAAALVGFLLLVVLLTEKALDSSQKWLIGLLGVMILVLFDSFFISLKLYQSFPHGLFLFSSLWIAIPTLLFLYQQAYLHPEIKRKWWVNGLHFIPLLYFAYSSLRFYGLPVEAKLRIGDFVYWHSTRPGLFALIFFVQNIVYITYGKALQLKADTLRHHWIRLLWWLWTVTVAFDLSLSLIALITRANVAFYKDLSILMYAAQAFFIAYHVLKKPFLFIPQLKARLSNYNTPTLSEERTHQLALRLNEMITSEQLYLNADIKQMEVSQQLGISSVELSQVLKQRFQQNFNEWINEQRVVFAQKKIKDHYLERYSIDALAQESGFASKVTFHRHFKRVTGTTPMAYQNGLMED